MIHMWFYLHSRAYRRAHAKWVMYRLHRLKGFSRTAAVVSIAAHYLCGTPMYYYPKHERERLRVLRELADAEKFRSYSATSSLTADLGAKTPWIHQ